MKQVCVKFEEVVFIVISSLKRVVIYTDVKSTFSFNNNNNVDFSRWQLVFQLQLMISPYQLDNNTYTLL